MTKEELGNKIMKNLQNIKQWADTWIKCYQISLGNDEIYKKRLKELEHLNIADDENSGKRIALRALIDYPNL
jgi:demethoxyubiquinone hydroxylase (CLK1/Coq7/Cat5 family)